MEPKPRSIGSKTGKSGNTSTTSVAGPEKKESTLPAPPPKKPSISSEVTPASNPTKPAAVETGKPEASGGAPDSDSKANGAEGESTRSSFENMKPLLLRGAVAVAAIAVILGVAFFARKKRN